MWKTIIEVLLKQCLEKLQSFLFPLVLGVVCFLYWSHSSLFEISLFKNQLSWLAKLMGFSIHLYELFFIGALFWIIYLIAMLWVRRKRAGNAEMRKQRLEKVYAPLRGILVDVHLASCSSILYPYLGMRMKRAMREKSLKGFLKVFFDKGIKTSGPYLEFGRFNLSGIEKIVKENMYYCDTKLVDLLQRVLRCQYEKPPFDNDLLDHDEINLINHIYSQYDFLSKK